MRRIAALAAILILLADAAWAGTGTITVKDSTGATQTFDVVTDGSGNFVQKSVICDQSAAAQCATVTAGNALKVDGSAVTQPVSGTVTANAGSGTMTVGGTVTANAGTNLNTSLLAVEAGGNLASVATSASTTATNTGTVAGAVSAAVMQSNTKQVNGVATLTGAGATGTGAQRVTAAQDTTTIAGSAPGTAGTPSANVVTVQGASSMTKLLVTPDSVALPANQSVNEAQIGAAAYALGQTTMSASAPVTVASDQSPVPVAQGCAGQTVANTLVKAFSNAASASNLKVVAGVSAKKIYVCGINVGPVGAAVDVVLVEGTKSSVECDTGTGGLTGGTTPQAGWIFAANGGIAYGTGAAVVTKEVTAADDMCLFFSGAVTVAGVLTYAQF